MPKPQPIEINIPNPCAQNWAEMTPDGQGRHCNHCSKTVIDFTTWSDRELFGFFSKNTEQVCGRMLSTQTNRYINIPAQPHSKLYVMFVAMGLTLIFTNAVETIAKIAPPFITQQSNLWVANTDDSTSKASGILSGTVMDDKKEPLISATVLVYKDTILVGGTVADFDGKYVISNLMPGSYDLTFSYPGYDTLKISSVVISPNDTTTQNVILERDRNSIGCTFVVGKIATNRKEGNHKTPKRHRKSHKRIPRK